MLSLLLRFIFIVFVDYLYVVEKLIDAFAVAFLPGLTGRVEPGFLRLLRVTLSILVLGIDGLVAQPLLLHTQLSDLRLLAFLVLLFILLFIVKVQISDALLNFLL